MPQMGLKILTRVSEFWQPNNLLFFLVKTLELQKKNFYLFWKNKKNTLFVRNFLLNEGCIFGSTRMFFVHKYLLFFLTTPKIRNKSFFKLLFQKAIFVVGNNKDIQSQTFSSRFCAGICSFFTFFFFCLIHWNYVQLFCC